MKSFNTLYGERDSNKSTAFIGFSCKKENVIKTFEEKYDEKVIKCIRLFYDKDDLVTGWLIITESRIIFYLYQDINRFKEIERIIWIIDNLYLENLNLKIIGENEIEISKEKKVLFSLEEYTPQRLINEVNSCIRKIKFRKPFVFFGILLKTPIKKIFFNKNFWMNPWIITIGGGLIVLIVGGIFFRV
jgi:hypothetical protein